MKITIPTSLKEIKLSQWVKFQALLTKDQEEEILQIFMVSIFCDIPAEEVLKINQRDLKDCVNQILQTLKAKPRHIQTFEHDGKEFGMIPNFDSMSAAEYIDLDKYTGDYETATRAMAVLYRPITLKKGSDYQIEKYEGSEKYNTEMQEISLEAYLSAQVFFSTLSIELLKATKAYLRSPQSVELEKALEKNGVGIPQFIQSLERASSILTEQQNY